MIITWMLSATAFAALLGVAALAAERLALATGRPVRWSWAAALVAGALWPVLLPLLQHLVPRARETAALLPGIRIVPDGAPILLAMGPGLMAGLEWAAVACWILASGLLILRLTRGIVLVRRIRARAESRVVDGMTVLVHDAIGPAAIGMRRCAVIIPDSVLELEPPLRRLVLRHEREHCDARDPWQLLAAAMATALFPWNPALWWSARRLQLAVELDCDARVLATGIDATRYGQLLLWTAHRRLTTPLVPMLTASRSHLERRIIAMRTRSPHARPAQLAAAVALLVVSLGVACTSRFGEGPVGPAVSPAAPTPAAPPPAPTESRATGPRIIPGDAPLLEYQTEQLAVQIPGTGRIRYPDAMRAANREGEVLAHFVVNEEGVPIPSTFKVLRSSDSLFTAAVRDAIPEMRFRPARVRGRAVKQLVQQPFTFGLSRTPGS